MPTAKVTIHSIVMTSQKIGHGTADHMVAVIEHTLTVGDRSYPGTTRLHQPFGSTYTKDSLEAYPPEHEYTGPWNHNDFREHCEAYFRTLLKVQEGTPCRATFLNCRFAKDETFDLVLPESSSSHGW